MSEIHDATKRRVDLSNQPKFGTKIQTNNTLGRVRVWMTIGELLPILTNMDKDVPIEGVSEVNYIMHRNGSVAVRFV